MSASSLPSSHLSSCPRSPLSSRLSQEKLTFGPRNSYTVEGLKANTEYSFSLAAISNKGIGAFTNELVQRTSQASTSLFDRVHALHLQAHTHKEMPYVLIISCLSLVSYANILSSTHTVSSTQSSAPDPGKTWEPSSHLSIYLIYQPICPTPPPIHPSMFDCAFLPYARPLAFLHSQNIMTDGDGAPINVSLCLFFTLLSLFPLYQCLMSLKGRNCLPLTG